MITVEKLFELIAKTLGTAPTPEEAVQLAIAAALAKQK